MASESDVRSYVERASSGDREAFAWVIETHYDLMYRVAYRYTGNKQDAEDVTHEACIKLARSIAQFRFESAFYSWLYRLVLNTAYDYLRSRSRAPESREDVPEIAIDTTAEPEILLRQVMQQIDRLGKDMPETVLLVIGEGLTHKEAADVLGVSESTISWRLHEVRKEMKGQVLLEESA